MILFYLAAINLVAFAAMGWDKRLAERGDRRISERDLLTLAAIGGSLGAIAAQQAFRHKTRKEPFRTLLWLTPPLQIALLAIWIYLAP